MKYDFGILHDRKNTNSVKYDSHREFGKRPDLVPMWVADTDFKVPIEVENALLACASHGIFGYSEPNNTYWEAVSAWFRDGFDYNPKIEYLIKTPGVVFALALAIRAFTDVGDAVLIQRPVYYPFSEVVRDNKRKLINNSLVCKNGRYGIDLEDFERKIVENDVKLFLLCSPHNPVGRVWQRKELEEMGKICLKHKCPVVSDEIHCDFVFAPHRHTVFATLSQELEQNSIICTSPSKTFNLAGLQAANIFISDAHLREKFAAEYRASGYSRINTMGLAACQSAYTYGRDYLSQLLEYLSGNMELVYEFCSRTGIRAVPLEGTYLAWLDFSPLGLSDREINALIDKAGLWLSSGTVFGREEGSGFQRINIACPRSVLSEALEKIEKTGVKL